jgi:hypothetical protein
MEIFPSSVSTARSGSSLPALSALRAHLATSKATKEELSTAALRGRLIQDPGYALRTRLAGA